MSPSSKTEKEEQTGVGARRSTRLAIAIPITLSGKDAGGNTFKESTRTIVVNKHGAKIATVHRLALGTEVEIENRALGLTARAAVVWVGDKLTVQKSFEAGIQLFKADNIWGIEFPPDDWREGPPEGTAAPGTEEGKVEPPPRAASTPAAPHNAPPAPAAKTPAPGSTPPSAAAPSMLQITADLEGMLQRYTRQAEGIAAQQTKAFQENLQGLSQQAGMEIEGKLRDAAARADENASNAARGLAVGAQALEERLQTLREEVEARISSLVEIQKSAGAEAEKTQHNVHEAAWQELEAATEELSERIQKELETVSADFLTEVRKRVQEETAAAVHSVTGEAEARLKARSEEAAAAFEESLNAILLESRAKSAGAAAEEVRRIVQEQTAALAGEVQKQIAEARRLLKEELKASWKDLAEEARQQLMNMATATAESMNSAATQGLNQFRGELEKSSQHAQALAGEKLEERLAKLAEERSAGLIARLESASSETEERLLVQARGKAGEAFSAQLEALAGEGLDKVRREFESLLERTRIQLEEATAVFQNQVMQEAQVKLAFVTERLTEDSATQLAAITKESLEMAQVKLEEAREKIVSESEDSFRQRLAEVIAPALKPNDRRSKPRFDSEPSQGKP